jgi:UDP-glucose 4-epimerase
MTRITAHYSDNHQPPPRVLVTGVAGFIGSHVAEACLRLGFEVVGVDDLSGGFTENIPGGVDFRQANLVDAEAVAGLWAERPFTYVYHLAAYAAEGLSHFIRRFNYQTNLLASINLINQSVLHGVKCFVFTSSIAVYGANQTPMTEDLTPLPEDPYGISKYAVELDLQAAHRLFGLPYIIFRPHNVYGERQNIADKYRNVIGIFMNQVMHNQPLTVFGDGLQTRAFSHVDDVAPLIARAPLIPAAYQQVFNVGADQPYTILELANEVARAFGVPPAIEHLPARQEVVHAFAAHAKAAQVFRPPPPLGLRAGLERMARWAQARGPATPVAFQNAIEVPIKMPAAWAKAITPSDASDDWH